MLLMKMKQIGLHLISTPKGFFKYVGEIPELLLEEKLIEGQKRKVSPLFNSRDEGLAHFRKHYQQILNQKVSFKALALMFAILVCSAAHAQYCDPEHTFEPAAVAEAHTEGFRVSLGVVGQRIPLSAFAGATSQVRIVTDKNGRETVETKIKFLVEGQFRLPLSSKLFSVNLYGNNYGAAVVLSQSVAERIAVRGRAGWESQFLAGIGVIMLL